MALDPQALLARRFEPIGAFEVARGLDAHDVCWGTYRTVRRGLAEDARLGLASPVFERITTPGAGEHLPAGAALPEQGRPRRHARRRCSATPLGADTDEVLHEVLRLPAAEIGRLHDAGIVAGPARDPTVSRG